MAAGVGAWKKSLVGRLNQFTNFRANTMPHITLTDAQIDASAKAYARAHGVNYAEALNHVVSFAEIRASGVAVPARTHPEPMTDAQLHAAVLRYSNERSVNYSEALTAVTSSLAMAQSHSFAEAAPQTLEGASDAALHAAATAYSLAHGIGYVDALNMVALDAGPSFAESSPDHVAVGDAALHALACAWVRSEGMDYAAALEYAAKTQRRKSTMEGFIGPGANFSEMDGAKQAIEGQEIEIFKVGNQVDNEGRARAFPVAVVVAMAAAYSPARHEAPLTLGHPADNLPAYGWVKSLRATADGRLMMRAGDVVPEFSEAVKAGRYKKRSASFYPPNAPNNPVPGSWYLRHVAWLGAQVPAVKGLADVNFNAAGDGAVCFGWV
jgi:hypothetical protein